MHTKCHASTVKLQEPAQHPDDFELGIQNEVVMMAASEWFTSVATPMQACMHLCTNRSPLCVDCWQTCDDYCYPDAQTVILHLH